MSSSVANLNESSDVKKLNLHNSNDKGTVQSNRQLEEAAKAYNFSKTTIGLAIARKDWTVKVPNNTTFTTLSLPGTHDSMTFQNYEIELAHCQSISLQGQLHSGTRALDIWQQCGTMVGSDKKARCHLNLEMDPDELDATLT